jgi:ergothioneine biosynthesis protein EgtB
MNLATSPTTASALAERFLAARRRTLELCQPLTPEDMMVQSCPDSSPAKWHLAHTAWFFESFVLREFVRGYKPFHPDFIWLFNSYYQTFAAFPEKRLRSSFSRPSLDQVLAFRAHVDHAIGRILSGDPPPEALQRIELGINHEEQHQELILTDILNAFFTNPLKPAYQTHPPAATESALHPALNGHKWNGSRHRASGPPPLHFLRCEGGVHEAGHSGPAFSFDNELPRHKVWLEPYALATRLVTCGEFAAFIADGAYRRSDLWLNDGWSAVQARGWNAPLYWSNSSGDWTIFTLRGEQPLAAMRDLPVSQVSFYEAEAYARWAGYRLPTEFEWEAAAEARPIAGNLLDSGLLMPAPAAALAQPPPPPPRPRKSAATAQNGHIPAPPQPATLFGDCWQWTASAYLPYPGFRPLPGSLGEYNGKFMSGTMVLRGGSCVTPMAHLRASYRNFFTPDTRWQFSGIRLASW